MGGRSNKRIPQQTRNSLYPEFRVARRNNLLKDSAAQMELEQLKTEFKLFRLETMAKIKELEERL